MATRSSILAWEIPWTEERGGLQCMRSQRVRHMLHSIAAFHDAMNLSITLREKIKLHVHYC